MSVSRRNGGGPVEFVVDTTGDLATIVNPRVGQFALVLFDGSLYYHTGTAWAASSAGGGGGAPTDANYLVGTANGSLSAEIPVGTTPGGELGGTWASPTVDDTHAGGTHLTLGTTAQAIGTSAGGSGTTASKVDHVHATGAGSPATVSTSNATGSGPAAAMTDHVHAHELAHIDHDTTWAAKGDLIQATANDTAAVLGVGSDNTLLLADSSVTTGARWSTVPTAGIAANAVTLAKMATQADQTFLGNVSGGAAVPVAATVAQVITALTGITGGLPVIGFVTSDVTFSHLGSANAADTTLQNATGLSFTLGASSTEIWLVELFLEWQSTSNVPDVKVGWATMPASATMLWASNQSSASAGYLAVGTGATPVILSAATATFSMGSGNVNGWGQHVIGKVYGGGTGGSIQFQASQVTSDTNAVTLKTGSVLRATKIKA